MTRRRRNKVRREENEDSAKTPIVTDRFGLVECKALGKNETTGKESTFPAARFCCFYRTYTYFLTCLDPFSS